MALNSEEYLHYLNVDIDKYKDNYILSEKTFEDEECFYVLLFIVNYICNKVHTITNHDEIRTRIKAILDNIGLIVEKCNYTINYIEGGKNILFVSEMKMLTALYNQLKLESLLHYC